MTNIIPNPEDIEKARQIFLQESEPLIKRLAEIQANKTPGIVKNIDANEVQFVDPEDSPVEREIKKQIELLRQKHFPDFTV